MKRLLSILLAVALVSSVFVCSGCKNDSDDRSGANESVTESKSTNNNPANKDELSKISAELGKFKKQPSYTATKAVDAPKIAKDKGIALILDSNNDDYSSYIALEIKDAAAKIGFTDAITYETDGTANSCVAALDNAVSDQCSAAVLIGNINKDEISSSIESAQSHGLKVISVNNANVGEKEHYVDYTFTINYNKEAKALADYAITEQNAEVNALLVIPSDISYSGAMKKAVTDELSSFSSGYCTELNAETSTWNNGLTNTIKEALEKDGNINCVIVLHEGMLKDAVNALEMTQTISKVKLIARGGGTSAFMQVQNGNASIVAAESYEWTAYLLLDCILKILGGQDNPDTAEIPFMMISYANAAALESSADSSGEDESNNEDDDTPFISKAFKKDFKNSFLKSWNVKNTSSENPEESEQTEWS